MVMPRPAVAAAYPFRRLRPTVRTHEDDAMTRWRLVWRSLRFFARTHLAVALGTLAAASVIGGALIVGDSVRDSLRALSLRRLGRIDLAVQSPRFFTEQWAHRLIEDPELVKSVRTVAPALLMTTAVELAGPDGTRRRAGKVQLVGVSPPTAGDSAHSGSRGPRLGSLTDLLDFGTEPPSGETILINERVARELIGARTTATPQELVGRQVTLWIEIPQSVPRDTLLGGGDKPVTRELTVRIAGVLSDEVSAARFTLNPSQQLPRTAYIPLRTLQAAVGLSQLRPSRRLPEGRPARINALFFELRDPEAGKRPEAEKLAAALQAALQRTVDLPDVELKVRPNPRLGYVALESGRLILDDPAVHAAQKAAETLGLARSPVYVYLANELTSVVDPQRYSMYSIVAGVDFRTIGEPPFGPWPSAVAERPVLPPAADDEIVINDWLAEDLAVGPGDRLRLTYYEVDHRGALHETSREFRVRDVVRLKDSPAADPQMTPEVRGITDVDDIADWDQPFEMQLDRVTERDDAYWDRFRATPKAFVNLAAAQRLWGTRYGRLTSFRVAAAGTPSGRPEDRAKTDGAAQRNTADGSNDLNALATAFANAVARNLDPKSYGILVQPVKWHGLRSASGTTDFAGLFVGFSFFLILAAVILIGLLFRLGIERRGAQIGLLAALGFAPRAIRRLLLCEQAVVIAAGSLLGAAAAVAYGGLMIHGLTTWWVGAVGTVDLFLSVRPTAVLAGVVGAFVVAGGAVLWGQRSLAQLSPRQLLAGRTERVVSESERGRRRRRNVAIALAIVAADALLLAAALSGLVPSTEAFFGIGWNVVCFFVIGTSLLPANQLLLAALLDADRSLPLLGRGVAATMILGMRNAGRNRRRSLLSVGLIATATFVIVAVAAGRRNPAQEHPRYDSGNGGFQLIVETSVPVVEDLMTIEGQRDAGLRDGIREADRRLLDRATVIGFRVRPGDDASCLNLYRTRQPTVLGVPPEMIQRGGFRFVNARRSNEWTWLQQELPENVIPAIADMNTMMYSLHKAVGDTMTILDESGRPRTVRFVAMLDTSVLQGVLLVSERHFLELFPSRAGWQYFLVGHRGPDAPPAGAGDERPPEAWPAFSGRELQRLADLFETRLAAYGADVERVADRLAGFLVVQNTYLSTFQALGGLGLVLGTLGLATVMLRNTLERRGEFALLRAVGFRRRQIAALVLWESSMLLEWGIGSGVIAALLAMLPHLQSTGADVPWRHGLIVLLAVYVAGMLASWGAVREATRVRIVQALRGE
ncbi:MAG: ABC transporter permease [Planctomycetota bacterium]|nr:MAG: ABC transporter permease [Planctomycetota bacterium]